MEPDGVVPANPLGRGGHDVDEFGPVSAVDQLGFVDRIERFGHGVVVGVAPRTGRGYNVVVGQSVGVVNGPVLHTTIAVMDQSVDVVAGTPPGGQGHGHSVGGQRLAQVIGHLPADDLPRVDVEDERCVDPTSRGGYVGDVGDS